jgi:hypothetical protein
MPKLQKLTLILTVASGLLLCSTASRADCEGADLEKANQEYEHMNFVNQNCNATGSVQDSMNCMREEWGYTSQRMSALPQECQDMLKEFEPEPPTE